MGWNGHPEGKSHGWCLLRAWKDLHVLQFPWPKAACDLGEGLSAGTSCSCFNPLNSCVVLWFGRECSRNPLPVVFKNSSRPWEKYCLLLLLLLKCVQKPFLTKWFVAATLPHLFFLLLRVSRKSPASHLHALTNVSREGAYRKFSMQQVKVGFFSSQNSEEKRSCCIST